MVLSSGKSFFASLDFREVWLSRIIILLFIPYLAPNWPSGRIKLIIEDAKPSMFLTNTKVDLIYKAISDMENDSLVPPVHQVSLK